MATIPTGGSVEVVRIPELPEELALANEDKIALWHAANNVTSGVSLQTLRSFIENGGTGTLDSIYTAGAILYIVPASAEGGIDYNNSAIQGMQIKVNRDGYPMKPNDEFLTLAGGGFRLVGTTFVEGQRYEITVFSLLGSVGAASTDTTAGFIRGQVNVNTNLLMSVNDANKIHSIRGGGTALTLTLPDVGSMEENGFFIIETLINNLKQHKINTTGGQYIYMNDEAETELYIGKGEYIWAYAGADGWYIIVDKGNFTDLGVPMAQYKAKINQVECLGQLLLRADYPRLWAFVQSVGASMVDDATWNTASAVVEGRTVLNPYCGYFSSGNGTTNFRLPNFSGMSIRGLKNYGSSDAARHTNIPGNYQRHEFEAHTHTVGDDAGYSYDNGPNSTRRGNGQNNPQTYTKTTSSAGGTETRVDNIGLRFFMNY